MKKRALILVDHGSTVKEANELLENIAQRINALRDSSGADFDYVSFCHMELSEPTIAQAFEQCVSMGAEDIVVHPYFLAPGRHSTRDIPRMVQDAAASHPGVSYSVTEPLGLHDKIIEVILERANSSLED